VLLWVSDSGLGERTDEEDQSNPPYINNAPMGFCLKKKEGHRKRCICMYGDGQGTSYLTLGHILVMFVMHSCVRSFLLGESLCLGLLHLKTYHWANKLRFNPEFGRPSFSRIWKNGSTWSIIQLTENDIRLCLAMCRQGGSGQIAPSWIIKSLVHFKLLGEHLTHG